MLAAQGTSLAVVAWLLSVGCDPRFVGPNTTYADGYGGGYCTAFHTSADAAIADCLLKHGADPNVIYCIDSYETYSKQEMSWSSGCGGTGSDYERTCVRHGGDVNRVLHWCGANEASKLIEAYWPKAVRSGNVDWARELLDKFGADPNWPQGCDRDMRYAWNGGYGELMYGGTVLMTAIRTGSIAMVKLLVDRGADVQLPEFVEPKFDAYDDVTEWKSFSLDCDRYFGPGWETREDPKVLENRKATPLSVAQALGNAAIIKFLSSCGATAHDDNAKVPFNPF